MPIVTEREHVPMAKPPPELNDDAANLARRFGGLIRQRREVLQMRQDDLALVSGLGRRFIVELEGGKPTAQLGKALVAANAVGLRPFDLMEESARDDGILLPDLPPPAGDDDG